MGGTSSTDKSAAGGVYGGGGNPYTAIRGGYEGSCACGGYVGGSDDPEEMKKHPLRDLKGYGESAAARAKDEIIRSAAQVVNEMLSGQDLPSDPGKALDAMRALIPDPKKGKGSFRADAESQAKVCKALATAFNRQFSPGREGHKALIDTDGEPAYICRAVAEIVDGLGTGMRIEFMDIQAELRRLLRNMEILLTIAEQEGDRAEGAVDKSGDGELRRNVGSAQERGAKALGSLRQQLETLRLILGTTIASAEKEMEVALREKDENIVDVLKGVGMDPSTYAFSANIAGTMAAMGTVATVARELNEALKTAGVGVGQFFDAASWADVEALADPKDSGADVGKALRAKEVLRKHFGHRGRQGLRAKVEGGGVTLAAGEMTAAAAATTARSVAATTTTTTTIPTSSASTARSSGLARRRP